MQFKEAVCASYLTRPLRMVGNVELPGNLECGCHLLGEFGNESQTIGWFRGRPNLGTMCSRRIVAATSAVSPVVGKASIHPEKVSTKVSR